MAKTYSEIKDQIGKLQAEAAALRSKEVGEVIARIKEAIAAYGLTYRDLGFKSVKTPRRDFGRGASQTVKYRDGSGNTWAGRGSRPTWLRSALAEGRSLQEFEVTREPAAPTSPDPEPPAKKPRVRRARSGVVSTFDRDENT